MRRHGRVDANHQAVREALERIGASVESLADLGGGIPDLLVGYRRRDVKFEVKDGSKPRSKRELTPAQVEWHARWKGSLPVVVYSPEEAVDWLQMWFGIGEER